MLLNTLDWSASTAAGPAICPLSPAGAPACTTPRI
jgi:hypothetical protein